MRSTAQFTRAALLVAASVAAAPAVAGDYAAQKVVYHNSGTQADAGVYFRHFLGNVNNHINAVGEDNIEIVVVAHGDGLAMMQMAQDEPDLAKRIDALRERDVRFVICRNTLTSREIALDDLYAVGEDDVIPSGVAEIARLEQQGFVYIHP